MAKFGGSKSILDPRKPFSVEEGGVITDLRARLRSHLVYKSSPVDNVVDLLTGNVMLNVVGADVDAFSIPQLYGSPTSWKLKKSTSPEAMITVGETVSHARDATTISFWFKNDSSGAPASLNPAQPLFTVTDSSILSASPPPVSKFTAFSVANTGGEELTFGWTTSSGFSNWYLSTRSTEAITNRSFGYPGNQPFGGDAPNANAAFVAEQPPNILEYGVWHHIVICTSRGNANDRNGNRDPNAVNLGYTKVYVNGKLYSRYLGYSEPGSVIKPYGTSPVEKYGFAQYTQLQSSPNDRLWFPYNATTGNRQFHQFCTWDRILRDDEARALYLGNLQGVYVDTVTSFSAPPRKQRQSAVKIVKNVNIGFADSQGTYAQQPFDDRRGLMGDIRASRGSNYPKDIALTPFPFTTENLVDTSADDVLPAKLVLDEVQTVSDSYQAAPYSENIDKDDMGLLDGTQASAIVRIPVPTQYASTSRQVAGRTDSKFARTVTNISAGKCSLFMSSVFKDDPTSFNQLITMNNSPTGLAGTGFLYYSPLYKTWVEKRSRGSWVTESFAVKNGSEYYDSVNSFTYNTADPGAAPTPRTFVGFQANVPNKQVISPWLVASNSYNPSLDSVTNGWYWSGSVSSAPLVSGVNETFAQFTSSPQLGYFLPFKEHLERAGYPTIGSPTVVFGAPFSPRYHGYDYETIKLSKYIDRPFRLKKVILRLPVTLGRKNEVQETVFGGPGGAEWTKNVPSRRDLDNYVFFLYRQRRQAGNVVDSKGDVSSSVRFIIASGSVCVYNSASFGRAYEDGFSSVFGTGTPVVQETAPGLFVTSSLNDLYNKCNDELVDPVTSAKLTRWSEPLHGPAYSVNAGVSDFSDGIHDFIKRGRIEVTMYPAVSMGGVLNSSLTYVTSTTGFNSSSLFLSEERLGGTYYYSYNQLFNRYPYTGSYTNPNNKLRYGPVTAGVQNIWLGGTRQPEFVNNALNGEASLSNVTASLRYGPYYAYKEGSVNDSYRNSFYTGYFGLKYTDPTFDVEITRTGISLSNYLTNVFSSPFQIVTDGRTIHGAFSIDNRQDLPSVFQRTNLIRYQLKPTDEGSPSSPAYLASYNTSIGNLSGSTMADLVSSLTVGNTVASPNTNRQILRDYILLPTDEIILGLDAGVTPHPDVAPLTGEPLPDKLTP
jgi:hypothetical protein